MFRKSPYFKQNVIILESQEQSEMSNNFSNLILSPFPPQAKINSQPEQEFSKNLMYFQQTFDS